jgi:hypothetical protein
VAAELADRDVPSGLVVWALDYKDAGDKLPGNSKTEADAKLLFESLAPQHLPSPELEPRVVPIVNT